MEILQSIVDDLKKLEDGVEMFDKEFQQVVLVVSLILFINADNPCHFEVMCAKHSADGRPCRFCYWNKVPTRDASNIHVSPADYLALPSDYMYIHSFVFGKGT